jgi:hypothetical protein
MIDTDLVLLDNIITYGERRSRISPYLFHRACAACWAPAQETWYESFLENHSARYAWRSIQLDMLGAAKNGVLRLVV